MIRITKQTDYGIVLMTGIAQAPQAAVHKTRELAAKTGIPIPMVSKILKSLARNDLLVSHRGVKGGYSLARPASAISVAEMIDALEGLAITECVDVNAGNCQHEGTCPVQGNWARINTAIRGALEGISLAEMARPLPPGLRAPNPTLV